MERNPRIRLFPLRALVGDIQPTICSFLVIFRSSTHLSNAVIVDMESGAKVDGRESDANQELNIL
jgi:hypothetical protein